MSVLQQLQETAGEPSGLPKVEGANPMSQEMMLNMEAAPIPGQSLTQDPENRMPWETPPEHVDVQEFVDEAFLDITDPDNMPLVLETLRNEIPVEYIAEQYLQKQVQKGKINPDVMMMSIEPIIYILLHQAAYAGIDPVLYPEDEMMDGEEEMEIDQVKNEVNGMIADEEPKGKPQGKPMVDMQAPTVVPKSLLARTEEAVNKAQGETDGEY